MRYLLDTHVFLWAETAPETIAPEVRVLLDTPHAELFISAVSAHEIAIKWSLGKLKLPIPPMEFFATRMARARLLPLPVSIPHALKVAGLPPVHTDPFDRLLIAQAQVEGLTILTRDAEIPKYEVPTLRA